MKPLLQRRFVVLHALVLSVLVATTLLGLWQFRRHGEVRAENERIAERIVEPAVGLDQVPAAPEEFAYRRVEVTGTYARDDEVLVRNRARNTINGFHVVTPLVTTDGATVLVNRGWVPIDVDTPDAAPARAPDGEVTVAGVLLPSQEPGGLGPRDPETGELDQVFRIDVDRIAQQLDGPVYTGYLQLDAQRPAQPGDLPRPVDPPSADAGPHLGYTLQWFGIGLTAAIAYGFYLRSRLRQDEDEAA